MRPTIFLRQFGCFCLLLATLSLPRPASSQVTGRTLEQGRFEVGLAGMSHKRIMEPNFPEGTTWGARTVYVRYGVVDWLTVSIEGFLTNSEDEPKFSDRDYRDLRFGAGLASNVWSQGTFDIVPAIQYSEWLSFDRSRVRHHKQVQSLLAAIEIQYSLVVDPVEGKLSFAPVFLHDEISQYTPYENYTDKSHHDLGVMVGIDLLVLDHVRLFAQGLFADFWQSKTGLGWLF